MKKIITLTIALLGAHFSSYSQAYDGYNDFKIFLGYVNVGGNSGIEYQNDYGRSDLFSWGTQVTYLINTKIDNDGEGFEKGFKFLDSFDGGGFARFHFREALNLREDVDTYLGADFTVRSLGAHAGFKYNISDVIGFYAMYKQSFVPLLKGDISLSEDRNGYPIESFFAKKAALSVGITFNLNRR